MGKFNLVLSMATEVNCNIVGLSQCNKYPLASNVRSLNVRLQSSKDNVSIFFWDFNGSTFH